MEQLKDSLGSLSANQRAASSSSSGTEREPPNDPIVGRLLARLTANYGAPWGRSAEDMALMYRDWSDALSGFSEQEIAAAAKQWIATSDVWPKVANIRQLVMERRPKPERRPYQADRWAPPTPEELARTSSRLRAVIDGMKERHKKEMRSARAADLPLEGASPLFVQLLSEDRE